MAAALAVLALHCRSRASGCMVAAVPMQQCRTPEEKFLCHLVAESAAGAASTVRLAPDHHGLQRRHHWTRCCARIFDFAPATGDVGLGQSFVPVAPEGRCGPEHDVPSPGDQSFAMTRRTNADEEQGQRPRCGQTECQAPAKGWVPAKRARKSAQKTEDGKWSGCIRKQEKARAKWNPRGAPSRSGVSLGRCANTGPLGPKLV